jgi:aminoglycoside phosphotransferase (APT) family kinase protein
MTEDRTASWISVVDVPALTAWLRSRGIGDSVDELRPLGGGTQNVVLRLLVDGRPMVFRRPPPHPRPESDRTMSREIAVLRALAGRDVPHPSLIAAEEDPTVLGTVFYVMEEVIGFNPGDELAPAYRDDGMLRHDGALSVARALARLGRIDPAGTPLASLQRPGSFLARQVPRWTAMLAGYAQLEGYRPAGLPAVDEVAAWLEDHRPADGPPGVLHGDFHLNNVLLHPERPEVTAIVDWEMATVGDPLLDLGWLLVSWPVPPSPTLTGTALAGAGALPGRAELLEAYAAAGGRPPASIDWYAALAAFKLGIVLEGTWARAQAGLAPMEVGLRLHAAATELLELADAIRRGAWSAGT